MAAQRGCINALDRDLANAVRKTREVAPVGLDGGWRQATLYGQVSQERINRSVELHANPHRECVPPPDRPSPPLSRSAAAL